MFCSLDIDRNILLPKSLGRFGADSDDSEVFWQRGKIYLALFDRRWTDKNSHGETV